MFKNNKTLGILIVILAALTAIYLLVDVFGGKTKSKGLRNTLVTIDTAEVSKIQVSTSGKKAILFKKENGWFIELPTGKTIKAEKGTVLNLFHTLKTIEPSRLISRDKTKWAEYQVDSLGKRVEIFEDDDKTLDLIIGKFNMEGQNSYSTNVRVFDETEVYSANNFFSFSLSDDPSEYRNQVVVTCNKDSLLEISFQYPDSSFVLKKQDQKWWVNTELADSASIESYLQSITYNTNKNFDDEFQKPISSAFSISIKSKGQSPIKIEAYKNLMGQYVIHSTSNPDAFFLDGTLKNNLWKGKTFFTKK